VHTKTKRYKGIPPEYKKSYTCCFCNFVSTVTALRKPKSQ